MDQITEFKVIGVSGQKMYQGAMIDKIAADKQVV